MQNSHRFYAHAAAKALDIDDGHRPPDALQRDLADAFAVDKGHHGGVHLAVDEDLAVARFAAKPRGEIDHRSDRRIVEAALEADAAQGGVAMGDADAEADLV